MYGEYDMYGQGYETVESGAGLVLGGLGVMLGMFIFFGIIMLVMIIAQWKIFKKAGKKGWESIVPIYNIIVLFEITATPTWMIVLFLIPIANLFVIVFLYLNLAKKFGVSTGFAIGMILCPIVFIPLLAFGKSQYVDGVYDNVASDEDISQNNMNNNISQVNVNNNIPNNMTVNNIPNNIETNVNSQNTDLGFVPQINSTNNNEVNNVENSVPIFNEPVVPVVQEEVINQPVNVVPESTEQIVNNNDSVQINNIDSVTSQNVENDSINPIQITNITNDISSQTSSEVVANEPTPVSIVPEAISSESIEINQTIENNGAGIGFSDLTAKIDNNLICPNCGSKYTAGDMFCINCGSKLN